MNSSAYTEFLTLTARLAAAFKQTDPQNVLLLHHNDTDGLSSGAILYAALERLHVRVSRICLEKPYPEVLTKILADPQLVAGTVIVFADFGSGMLPEIAACNKRRHPVFVLDHHAIAAQSVPEVTLLNPLGMQIAGSSECSASAVCYLFAEALNRDNTDLARLGVLGAIGDRHFDQSGKLSGLNAIVADRAQATGTVQFKTGYLLSWDELSVSAQDLVQYTDALGSVGYFSGGPDIGVKGLLDGPGAAYQTYATAYRDKYEAAVQEFMRDISLQQTEHLQWFKLDKRFSDMGVKTVGLVCEYLCRTELVDQNKYVAGYQVIPDRIPGLGPLALRKVKISMRLPAALERDVRAGRQPALTEILPPATRALGGFVDACHLHAAATVVDIGQEEQLIQELEKQFGTSMPERA